MISRDLYQKITQLHEDQRLWDFSVTLHGNITLWVLVVLLLSATEYLFLVPVMVVAQLFPAKRLWIMGIGGGGLFLLKKLNQLQVFQTFWFAFDAAIIIGLIYLLYRVSLSFSRLPKIVKSNPQVALHLLLWLAIIVIFYLPDDFRQNPAWVFTANLNVCLIFFSFLVWRLGFMLYSGKRGSIKKTNFLEHLTYCLPYLGSSQVPFGKGLEYLNSKMADGRLDLAKAQMAGLKLLVLAFIWDQSLDVLDWLFFSHDPNLPPLFRLYHITELIAISATTMPHLAVVWSSLVIDMVYETTQLAIYGHMIVGCLRLFGFHVFRNTYKPLLAKSLIDFWNRYYFYFKELLVDFFFFPIYLSFFRSHPKLRIFAATMASACFGNFYYHFLQHFDRLMISGEPLNFAKFSSYLFYTAVLGLAIFLSILKEQNQRGKEHAATSSTWTTVRKIAGVWLFFTILRIWDHGNSSFMTDTTFFFAIFGIRL
ncbi:hypothetical protein SIID45300_00754 [Candidatus Magnetaquicoccaceae bacterium FCR-1]|uniref:MBOAT family protein n=1 Tax=Candidatus Magnetaquiglobus chichijimensis TaxID=3141448 RepID=A0ABQ0C6D3_9PROT